MQSIKNIEDTDLKENDIVRYYCKKCNKNTLHRIIAISENMTGMCGKCMSYVTLKRNENYISEEQPQNIPKCPTCNSINVEKIPIGKKALGGAMFGLFSSDIRNTMHCKNCGYKW